jgi:DNA-binding IclR family transcriptional regulator
MLEWASGYSYISFCEKSIQDRHFDLIDHAREQRKEPMIDRPKVRAKLDNFRRQGFGFRAPTKQHKSASIGVPIRKNNEIIGSIVLNYFGRHLTKAMAAELYVPKLNSVSETPKY